MKVNHIITKEVNIKTIVVIFSSYIFFLFIFIMSCLRDQWFALIARVSFHTSTHAPRFLLFSPTHTHTFSYTPSHTYLHTCLPTCLPPLPASCLPVLMFPYLTHLFYLSHLSILVSSPHTILFRKLSSFVFFYQYERFMEYLMPLKFCLILSVFKDFFLLFSRFFFHKDK